MKNDIAKFAIAFFALSCGMALEELLPKLSGAGFPFLLSFAIVFASRRKPLEGVLFAAAAGAAEDAASALPFAVSISFFVAAASIVRAFKIPVWYALPAHALHQIWIWVWLGARLEGSIFNRILAAVPLGAAALWAVTAVVARTDRRAAIDER